ncbi:hypothetical protein [Mannheimia massilioguelmaensis]|uniref:hypothetical protein n=1 Tax=Mannheimia massilioguelmaensis TaxID=1604354 RepID=UPI0005CACCF0|nr:hypothetical protein [Mannheimia massilioguelmaensis]
MSKKVGAIILGILIALLVFLHIQKDKAETKLITLLQKQGIEVHSLDFSFLLRPAFTAEKISYVLDDNQVISFERATAELAGLSVFSGDFTITQLQFDNGKFWRNPERPELQSITLSVTPAHLNFMAIDDLIHFLQTKKMKNEKLNQWLYGVQFKAKNRHNDDISLATKLKFIPQGIALKDTQISVDLNELDYSNNKQFNASIGQTTIISNLAQLDHYEFVADTLKLNSQDLGRIHAKLNLPKGNLETQSMSFTSSACNYCNSSIHIIPSHEQSKIVQFKTEFFPIEKLLSILKLPVVISGKSDVSAVLHFGDTEMTSGTFDLNVMNGKLQGLNLISLVAQYLPINYDEEKLKNLETNFLQYNTKLNWLGRDVYLENMSLRTDELILKGYGKADLRSMKCDVMVNIGVNNPNYKNLSLPIRFFDDCSSPQYKVEITKDFRQQLKNFMKEKFK